MVNEKLAKLIARHPNFTWEPGMLVYQHWGASGEYKKLRIRDVHQISLWTNTNSELYPDLEDWATCGILLGKLIDEIDDRTLSFDYNSPYLVDRAWTLRGDEHEPYEIWDSFGGIIAASLLFVWNKEEVNIF